MRKRLPLVQHARAVSGCNWRPVAVIQQPLSQIRCRNQIFQALLILNTNHVATEVIRYAERRDIHSALVENLIVGEIGLRIWTGKELHPLRVQPASHRLRFGRRY